MGCGQWPPSSPSSKRSSTANQPVEAPGPAFRKTLSLSLSQSAAPWVRQSTPHSVTTLAPRYKPCAEQGYKAARGNTRTPALITPDQCGPEPDSLWEGSTLKKWCPPVHHSGVSATQGEQWFPNLQVPHHRRSVQLFPAGSLAPTSRATPSARGRVSASQRVLVPAPQEGDWVSSHHLPR